MPIIPPYAHLLKKGTLTGPCINTSHKSVTGPCIVNQVLNACASGSAILSCLPFPANTLKSTLSARKQQFVNDVYNPNFNWRDAVFFYGAITTADSTSDTHGRVHISNFNDVSVPDSFLNQMLL